MKTFFLKLLNGVVNYWFDRSRRFATFRLRSMTALRLRSMTVGVLRMQKEFKEKEVSLTRHTGY
ncbi:MAG: hypothetical protein WCS11_06535 [Dysgonamonadaceae bacterium]|nr:hypothetical protein [Dysgonamonadaceae bacterium]